MSSLNILDCTIERLIWGGYGLTIHPDGRRILVKAPVALFPGDVVQVQLQMKRNHAIGMFLGWIKKSQKHVNADCDYAYSCGGCSFWEAGDNYSEFKQTMISDLIYQQQVYRDREWEWIPARIDNKRCRIQMHYVDGCLGFYKWKSNEIIDIDTCLSTHNVISEAIPKLTQALEEGHLPKTIERLELVCDYPPKTVWVVNPINPIECWVWHNQKWIINHDKILYKLAHKEYEYTPGSFFQAVPELAELAFSSVFDRWEIAGSTLYDLYGGCGFCASLLSAKFKRIVLVESNLLSIADAKVNLATFDTQFVCKSVESWFSKPIIDDNATIILDPPRTGIHERIIEPLKRSRVKNIILIGCDGACFWRDVRRLIPNWQLRALSVVDLFPNTPHAEFIGVLTKD